MTYRTPEEHYEQNHEQYLPWEDMINEFGSACWQYIAESGMVGLVSSMNMAVVSAMRFALDHPETALYWCNTIGEVMDMVHPNRTTTEREMAEDMYQKLAVSYDLPK